MLARAGVGDDSSESTLSTDVPTDCEVGGDNPTEVGRGLGVLDGDTEPSSGVSPLIDCDEIDDERDGTLRYASAPID